MMPHPVNNGRNTTVPAKEPRQRSLVTRALLMVSALLLIAGFTALGSWQVQRLHWKEDLMARVEQRVDAAPVPAPGSDQWQNITPEAYEYLHVRLTGTYLYHLTTPVQASTRLGRGFWLLTPLQMADGSIVLINRGFIPESAARQLRYAVGEEAFVSVTGLLRMSEPGGRFPRENVPSANRWYSRDVAAIAKARGLGSVAPYFVDADAMPVEAAQTKDANAPVPPTGGLTVTSFPNNHLVYALTWYALALMVAAALFWVRRDERRQQPSTTGGDGTSSN